MNIRTTQAISSADTSIKQVAAGFKLAQKQGAFNKTCHLNIDLGGGKYCKASQWAADNGFTSLVHDKFNRRQLHNDWVEYRITSNNGADSVTCFNVLNVIQEPEVRQAVITQAWDMLASHGVAYFTAYEGNRTDQGKVTSKGWQNNKKTAAYVAEISTVFAEVERKGSLIIAWKY